MKITSLAGLLVGLQVATVQSQSMFKACQRLQERVPFLQLSQLPTPVQKSDLLPPDLCRQLYIKRDDQVRLASSDGGHYFGGNKIRKLQFLLADAQARKADSIITFGAAGSNHAVETAACCKHIGLPVHLILHDQAKTNSIPLRLKLGRLYGARQTYRPKSVQPQQAVDALVREYSLQAPYVIPVGGSNPIGMLGYVDAAFELVDQCREKQLVIPDVVYVPCGSRGTAVGLAYGFMLAGVQTRVEAVAVDDQDAVGLERAFESLNEFVQQQDAGLPSLLFDAKRLHLRVGCEGEGYAVPHECTHTVNNLFARELLVVDGTYTVKAAIAMFEDALNGLLSGKTVLFWLTLDGADYHSDVRSVDIADLPPELLRYCQ